MRKEKQLLLDEIKEKFDGSRAWIITRYMKLEPNASWQFRERLAKSDSLYEVVKKRVFLQAAKQAGIEIDGSQLKGHLGIVFINQEDAMAPAKEIFKFSEENGDLFQVVFGQIEGKMVPGAEVEALSKLPGLDEMRALMIALFTSPMTQTLAVMEAFMEGPLSDLEQKS